MKCSPISPRAALPMMAILMVAGTARAAGTISSGSATFSILDSAPGALKPTDFRPLGAAAGNYLFEDFWAYNPFFSGTSFFGVVSESYVGDTATILTDNANTPGTIVYKIAATPLAVTLTSTVTFTLTAQSSSSVKLYHYGDVDAGATKTNTAQLVGGLIRVQAAGATVDFSGTSGSAYQVAAYPTLRPIVLSSPSQTLNNTGLPFGPGDFTGAYEWDFAMTQGVPVTRSVMYTVPVPEPVGIVTGLATATLLRRRRMVRDGRRAWAASGGSTADRDSDRGDVTQQSQIVTHRGVGTLRKLTPPERTLESKCWSGL